MDTSQVDCILMGKCGAEEGKSKRTRPKKRQGSLTLKMKSMTECTKLAKRRMGWRRVGALSRVPQ